MWVSAQQQPVAWIPLPLPQPMHRRVPKHFLLPCRLDPCNPAHAQRASTATRSCDATAAPLTLLSIAGFTCQLLSLLGR